MHQASAAKGELTVFSNSSSPETGASLAARLTHHLQPPLVRRLPLTLRPPPTAHRTRRKSRRINNKGVHGPCVFYHPSNPPTAHGSSNLRPQVTSLSRPRPPHHMAGRYTSLPGPTRDSLELASLASSSHPSQRTSLESSDSGAPSSRRLSFDDEDPLSELNPAGHGEGPPRHNRSYSVSSAFDFAPNLFPLSSTAQGYTALGAPSNAALDPSNALNGGSLEKNKSLTYLNGLSLVVGLIIGSGIFSSPSQVNRNAGSPGASLVIWVVAGILAWTGAASYAELGGAIPLNGGAQVYLSKIFGEWAGFLFTWCAVVVLKPGSAAIIAIIFGEYLVRACIGADAVDASTWLNKAVAMGGLILVTLLNCVSTKVGTRSADIFMFMKFLALIGVTVTGIVVAVTGFSYKGPASDDWKTKGWWVGTNTDVSNWAVALYAGLWAFDGWDNVRHSPSTSLFVSNKFR